MILITRPLAQALETQVRIDFLGYNCVIYPLLEIIQIPNALDHVSQDFDNIMITSRNAAEFVKQKEGFAKDKKFFVVGKETAEILSDYNVQVVGQNVEDLLKQSKNINLGNCLYLSGDHISHDLTQYGVKRVVIYKSLAATHLPLEVFDRVDTVLLYSKRTAEIFKSLTASYDLSKCTALCFSEKIAQELGGLGLKGVKISSFPTEDSLLSLLPVI